MSRWKKAFDVRQEFDFPLCYFTHDFEQADQFPASRLFSVCEKRTPAPDSSCEDGVLEKVGHASLDLKVVGLSPRFSVKITLK